MISRAAVLRCGLTVALAYAVARISAPLLRRPGAAPCWASWLLASALFFAPLLIPASAIVWRALAAIACLEFAFKMLDYRRQFLARRVGDSPADRRRYVEFLTPFFPPFLVTWGLRDRRKPTALSGDRVAWLGLGGALVAGGFLVLGLRSRFSLPFESFAVDHAIVFVAFLLAIEGLSLALTQMERLAGFDIPPLVRGMLRSRTPAEFWMRYNTRVHRWLRDNVFVPAGGSWRPAWGALFTFFVSALLHEVAFAVATSVLDGRQFAFFFLQAPAALLSPALERVAKKGGLAGRVFAHAVTILWFYLTSILFFHGVQRVFPFLYARPI